MSYNDCCVVSMGVGGWYPSGIKRLKRSLYAFWRGKDFLTTDYLHGCPKHQTLPYAFKPWLLLYAHNVLHFRRVLWVDASFWAVRDINPVFDAISEHGVYAVQDGWTVGQWSTDAALEAMGVTREHAFTIPLLWAAMNGWDMEHPLGKAAFDHWYALAMDGVTFPGPWNNDDGSCSPDPRVLGHRHDQTALSVVCHQHGVPLDPISGSFCTPDRNHDHPRLCFRGEGM